MAIITKFLRFFKREKFESLSSDVTWDDVRVLKKKNKIIFIFLFILMVFAISWYYWPVENIQKKQVTYTPSIKMHKREKIKVKQDLCSVLHSWSSSSILKIGPKTKLKCLLR